MSFQVAVSQRLLPLRCVVCRAKVLRLRQARDHPFPTSVSQYSMSSVAESSRVLPTSHSLYSFTSGSSGISGKFEKNEMQISIISEISVIKPRVNINQICNWQSCRKNKQMVNHLTEK